MARDRGLAEQFGQALNSGLSARYRGPKRGYAEGLSQALAIALVGGGQGPSDLGQAISDELTRGGWGTDLAGAIGQALMNAAAAGDYTPLLTRLAAEAEQASDAAQVSLGVLHAGGRLGAAQSWPDAIRLFQRAAAQENSSAQFNLGVLYYFGTGTQRSAERAVEFFQKAAVHGDPDAQYNLGICYLLGHGVARDESLGLKWIRLAADRGQADAQCQLGLAYLQGTGVAPDAHEAARWLTMAASAGVSDAQCQLGVMYAEGIGVGHDDATAERWLTAAAKQRFAQAQYYLSFFLTSRGRTNEARAWLESAADQGLPEACETRARLNQPQSASPSIQGTLWQFDSADNTVLFRQGGTVRMRLKFGDIATESGGGWQQEGTRVTFDANGYTFYEMQLDGASMKGTWRQPQSKDPSARYSILLRRIG